MDDDFQVGDTLVACNSDGRNSVTRFVRVTGVTRSRNLRIQELTRVSTHLYSNVEAGKWEVRPGEGLTENKYVMRNSRQGYSFYIVQPDGWRDRWFYFERYDPQQTYTDSYISD